jgi:hypothetical protein
MTDVTKLVASRITWSLAFAASALFGSGIAAGQSARNAVGEKAGLEEIVVTAQRRAEDIQHVAIRIQTSIAKDPDQLGMSSSTDIGQFASNVEIVMSNGARLMQFDQGGAADAVTRRLPVSFGEYV